MDLASAFRMPSPVWINVAPEKSFHSLRSLSRTMKAFNPTHVPFLNIFVINLILNIIGFINTVRLDFIKEYTEEIIRASLI